MMRYTCSACEMGQHDMCDGKNPPPAGMLGGSECICDGNCAEREPCGELHRFVQNMTKAMEEARA